MRMYLSDEAKPPRKPPPPKGAGLTKDWTCAACKRVNKADAPSCVICSKRAPDADEAAAPPLVKSVAAMKRATDVKAKEIQGLTDDIQGFLADLRQGRNDEQ